MVSFNITQTFPVSAETIYQAWLNSKEHSNMTGGEANCSNKNGEPFTAWDGYIRGLNIKLSEGKEIVQSWRTTEFDDSDLDSLIKIELIDTENGCELTLSHSDIPEGQPDYEQGWQEHYFEPMMEYFSD